MKTTEQNWVLTYKSADGSTEIENLDGVSWHDAPVPPRLHRCTPQTRGWMHHFDRVYRCACGAISDDAKHWSFKNERRRS